MQKNSFLWVGNCLAIDFVNTEMVASGKPVDLLPDPKALLEWLREAKIPGLMPERLDQAKLVRAFKIALGYRELLSSSLSAACHQQPLPATLVATTNMFLVSPENAPRLIEKDGKYRFAADPSFRTPKSLLTPVAGSFAKLLSEADLRRLRKCTNPDCVLYFYDTSKSGTRAYCSLDLCGNKLRMAASRRKQLALRNRSVKVPL